MNYIYFGEATVRAEEIDDFIRAATELKIKNFESPPHVQPILNQNVQLITTNNAPSATDDINLPVQSDSNRTVTQNNDGLNLILTAQNEQSSQITEIAEIVNTDSNMKNEMRLEVKIKKMMTKAMIMNKMNKI